MPRSAQLLEEKKLLLKSGTIVDATIIAAPPSTKNAAQERDPEMKQTRKGKQWHFGMKVHVGTDRRGLVHSVVTGPASEGDITRLDDLLHGQERELFGDQAYWSEDHRQHCRQAGIALPSQSSGQARAGSDRAGEGDQPLAFAPSRARRARVSCREAPVGLHQGALPRAVQEHGARADDVRAVEPVHGATTVAGTTGEVRPMSRKCHCQRAKTHRSASQIADSASFRARDLPISTRVAGFMTGCAELP